MRILGVDPGSRLTGYGCVDGMGNRIRPVTHGTLRLANVSGRSVVPFEDRLLGIYTGLTALIREFKPQIMVVEKVFFAKNAVSSLKLGQARGAVILTGKIHSLQIVEYSSTEVKQVVTGYGRADKIQVARMVQIMTGQQKFETNDASDGMALAICHALFSRGHSQLSSSLLQSETTQRKKRLSLAESVGLKLPKKI